MSLFSQRHGITPLSKSIQRESLDDDLRNCLWTALSASVWELQNESIYSASPGALDEVLTAIWIRYFKRPIDSLPHQQHMSMGVTISEYRRWYFAAEWWEVLDFIEFISKNVLLENVQENLSLLLNDFLKQENSAYRFVGNEVVEITDEIEIRSIEEGLAVRVVSAKEHLSRALELLSDRKSPDYRNSVKESISAVESTCRALTGNRSATLGDCLKNIDDVSPIHPAFKEALNKLYGYTSDANGIRHSLREAALSPSYADAKFMLVSASAFINYLLAKSSENPST